MATQRRTRRKQFELVPAERLIELGRAVEKSWDVESDSRGSHERALFEPGRVFLTAAWAAAVALAGDTSQLGVLLEYIESHEMDDYREAETLLIASALHLARAPERRSQVYHLANSNWSNQLEMAQWLDPAIGKERELLIKIATSGNEWVAKSAREALAKAGDTLWWETHFAFDPLDGLPPEAVASVLPDLHRLIALREDTSHTTKLNREIVAIIGRLPARAALAAAEPLLAENRLEPAQLLALLGHLSMVPNAVGLLVRLGCDWEYDALTRMEQALEKDAAGHVLPASFRDAFSTELLRSLGEQPYDAIVDESDEVRNYAHLLAKVWPAERDPKPLLDYLLDWGALTGDYVGPAPLLSSAIMASGHGRDWLRPMFRDGLRENFEGRWHLTTHVFARLTDDWPEEERVPLAHETLERNPRGFALRWAVEQLPMSERVARYEDPLVRPELFRGKIAGPLMVLARRDLRASRLTYVEAASLMYTVNRVWGGCAHIISANEEENEGFGGENSPERAPFENGELDPSFGGRFTAAEWTEVRRLRAIVPIEEAGEDLHFCIMYPRGTWHPEDRRFFDALCEYKLATHDREFLSFLGTVAADKGDAAHLPVLERIRELSEDYFDRHAIDDSIHFLRRKLGLPPEPEADEEFDAANDEDEDDDW